MRQLRVLQSGSSTFPCTSCGACCAYVQGPPKQIWKERGWLLSNGSCKHYDPLTRNCKIYDERPIECRIDEAKPKDMPMEQWHHYVESCCDVSHKMYYGVARERGMDCNHDPAGKLEVQLETTSTCNASCHFCPYPAATERHGHAPAPGPTVRARMRGA